MKLLVHHCRPIAQSSLRWSVRTVSRLTPNSAANSRKVLLPPVTRNARFCFDPSERADPTEAFRRR